MREDYKIILGKMVKNKDVINGCIDGRKLLLYLQVHEHLMTNVLQSRNDEAMKHFLDSLEDTKYEEAHTWLKEKLDNPNLTLLWKCDQTYIRLKTAMDNLRTIYGKRLKFMESYWKQFGVKSMLEMETFYNHNIVISNEKYKQIQKKIESFNDIFSTDYEGIIVMAEAGYGKSTFVHEMARQWAKGDKEWTKKFEFLFLFRLTEVNENESKSLENLLTLCLYPNDVPIVYSWLKDGNMSKALFIFDGLDELRHTFCLEINELIFGGKVNQATVVITSRQCEKLADIDNDGLPKLYIELKGYTEDGVIQQLQRFSVPVDGMQKGLKNHLKIPLFNTIFCITHTENNVACTNICSSVHRFLNFAIKRYRNSNQNFTVSCEEKLLLTLGQAAQNKFSFIKNIEIPYPNVSRDHLSWAIKSGLLHNSSQLEDLVFAHQTIAEYCAAYYWCKTKHLVIEGCGFSFVELTEPQHGSLKFTEPFSQFLCLLSREFKEEFWQKFGSYVPIFDEYENLPCIWHTGRFLQFTSHSVDDQVTVMNKLRFDENKELRLINGQFEQKKLFQTIEKLKTLYLLHCTFNIGAEEFFNHFTNLQSLTFYECKFYELNIVYDDPHSNESNSPCLPHLPLQKLEIFNCSIGLETFLPFIMKHCTFMKSFKLHTCSLSEEEKRSKNVSIKYDVDHCGSEWISELHNNKHLCNSIENCELWFAYPITLIQIIETFKTMQNIKQLNLRVLHKLSKLQAHALADLLEVGLSSLKTLYLNIKMENQKDYEPILKNLSKLSALTSLDLRNEPFTTDTLNYLADIFNKLKLEESEFDYQEIFFEERIINSINSCRSLKNITFQTKKMEDSNFVLLKKRIEIEDRQLRIIEKDYFWDH